MGLFQWRRGESLWRFAPKSVAAIALLALVVGGIQVIRATKPPVGSDSDADFQLSIEASRPVYAEHQEVRLTTTLTYTGPEPSVTVSGPGIIAFSEAREGGMVIGPFVNGDWCRPPRHALPSAVTLERDVPHEFPFYKSGSWGAEDPTADFLRDFFSDLDTLTLPSGTWRVTAHSDFSRSIHCAEPTVHLEAHVTIEVMP
jgi:hypothetical protein